LFLKPLQREIERSVIYQEDVVRFTLDGARDSLTVLWSGQERPQNEEVESSL